MSGSREEEGALGGGVSARPFALPCVHLCGEELEGDRRAVLGPNIYQGGFHLFGQNLF